MSDQTNAKLDRVVGRALRDEEFREQLNQDPAAALKGEGLTDEDLEAVSGGALGAYNFHKATSLNFAKISLSYHKIGSLQGVKITGDGSV